MAIPGFHTANQAWGWLQYYGWRFMAYRPYGLNFMPSNFHIFGPLKKHVTDYFAEETAKEGVTSWVQQFGTDFFCARIYGGLMFTVCCLCVTCTFTRADPKIPGIVKKN